MPRCGHVLDSRLVHSHTILNFEMNQPTPKKGAHKSVLKVKRERRLVGQLHETVLEQMVLATAKVQMGSKSWLVRRDVRMCVGGCACVDIVLLNKYFDLIYLIATSTLFAAFRLDQFLDGPAEEHKRENQHARSDRDRSHIPRRRKRDHGEGAGCVSLSNDSGDLTNRRHLASSRVRAPTRPPHGRNHKQLRY